LWSGTHWVRYLFLCSSATKLIEGIHFSIYTIEAFHINLKMSRKALTYIFWILRKGKKLTSGN
jgi:hypothetical protein